MALADHRKKQRRVSARWSVGFLGVLLLHALVTFILLPKGSGYQLNWQSHFQALLAWMIFSVGCLPLAGLVGTIAAAVSRSSAHVIGSLGLLVLGGLGALSSVVVIGWMSTGGGPAQVVATAQTDTSEYRLEYRLAGDPTTTVYEIRECTPDGVWCRSLGFAYGYRRMVGIETATIQAERGGTFSIVIGGIIRATIDEDRIVCVEVEALCSPD